MRPLRPSARRTRAFLIGVIAGVALLLASAAPAPASPGALRILIVEALCNPGTPAATLGEQIRDEPGVSSVDLVDGSAATPGLAQLRSYDAVVAMGDCSWLDPVAFGDNLADFQDGGGVVIGAGSDWRGGSGGALAGRWISAGHSPFQVGAGTAFTQDTFAWMDSSNPIMANVPGVLDDEGDGPPSAYYRYAVSLAGGGAELARWGDGITAVAVKGRAVGINAYIGDHYGPGAWTGDYGTIVANAANALGPRANIAPAAIACVVPRLKGVRADAALRRLKHAHCRLRRVRGHGRLVSKQSLKPGTVLPPGTRVDVRLGA